MRCEGHQCEDIQLVKGRTECEPDHWAAWVSSCLDAYVLTSMVFEELLHVDWMRV